MDRSILLVEDDPSLGMILKEYLTIKGYNVELAIDGESGLNAFLKHRPHLCIIDIMMPKKDGFELAKEIKIVDNFVPIIFLSAKSGIHDKIKGLSIGADDYVIKPFIAEELLLRIEAILRRTGITDATFNESYTINSNMDINKNKFKIGEYIFDYNLRILQFNTSLQAFLRLHFLELVHISAFPFIHVILSFNGISFSLIILGISNNIRLSILLFCLLLILIWDEYIK